MKMNMPVDKETPKETPKESGDEEGWMIVMWMAAACGFSVLCAPAPLALWPVWKYSFFYYVICICIETHACVLARWAGHFRSNTGVDKLRLKMANGVFISMMLLMWFTLAVPLEFLIQLCCYLVFGAATVGTGSAFFHSLIHCATQMIVNIHFLGAGYESILMIQSYQKWIVSRGDKKHLDAFFKFSAAFLWLLLFIPVHLYFF